MPQALIGGAVVVIGLAVAGLTGGAQQKGEWPGITGGDTSTRYSPLDQINAANFNTLKIAWEWNGKDVPPGVEIGEINARGLPIYVDGMLITVSGPRRTVVSLDPATGRRCGRSRSRGRRATTTRCGRITARASRSTASTAARSSS
jgi:glucose dehydrogenase